MNTNMAYAYDDTTKLQAYVHKGLMKCERIIFKKYLYRNDKVLDVGCYAGRVSFEVAKMCKSVVGIDISETGIEIAKSIARDIKVKNCCFILASAADLPFTNHTFHKIIIPYNSLENIPEKNNRMRALKECYRTLKSNGLLIFSIHNRFYPRWLLTILAFNTFRRLYRIDVKIAINLARILRLKAQYLNQLANSELHSVPWREPSSILFSQYYFYTKKECIEECSYAGFERLTFHPIGNQNPFSGEGKNTEILRRRMFLVPPLYYVIARKV